MYSYTFLFGFLATALAQNTYTGNTITTTTTSGSNSLSTPAIPVSQICGIAGYDLGNPKAAAYDGSGLYGTFSTCKSWCTNYLSFAVGSGVCLCYSGPVDGNLNAVPVSPNVYYDMSCPEPAVTSLLPTASTTASTTTFTLVSSTSSTTSITTAATSQPSSVLISSSTITSTTRSTTSTTSIQYTTTKVSTTTTVPTTLVTKTTTSTTTTATSTLPTSACFKLKVNNQYIAQGSFLTSNLVSTTGTPSVFYLDKYGYVRNAADNYAMMRTLSNLINWNFGYISRLGIFPITATKNTSAKTLSLSNWFNGAAPVWTSTKNSALQHGSNPGSGWSQATVNYEDVTCPATARV